MKYKSAILITIILVVSSVLVDAQNSFVIVKGTVIDETTDLPIVNVNIFTSDNKQINTDKNGLFKYFTLPEEIQLTFMSESHYPFILSQTFYNDTSLIIKLRAINATVLVDEITITGSSNPAQLNPLPGFIPLQVQNTSDQLAIGGERSIQQILQQETGVLPASEGSSEFSVRGGTHDQNLILIDGLPVYSSGGFYGLISPFGSEWISSASFYKASPLAKFGGRLSSVLDIQSKVSNLEKYWSEHTLGLLSFTTFHNIPILKNKLGITLQAKRSFWDVWQRLRIDENSLMNYFGQVSGNLLWNMNPNNQIVINSFAHSDNYEQRINSQEERTKERYLKNQYEAIRSLIWRHNRDYYQHSVCLGVVTQKTQFLKWHQIRNDSIEKSQEAGMSILDIHLKYDMRYQPTSSIRISSGIHFNRFMTGLLQSQVVKNASLFLVPADGLRMNNLIEYVEGEMIHNKNFRFIAGLRSVQVFTDSQNWFYVLPRVSISYHLSAASVVKLGYGRSIQPYHRLTNPGIGHPLSLWMPSSSKLAPQAGGQFSLELLKSKRFFNALWNINLSLYYKKQTGLPEFKDGHGPSEIIFGSSGLAGGLEYISIGEGHQYGFEFYLSKKTGKLTADLGYSCQRSLIQVTGINNEISFPSKYDIPHQIEFNLNYSLPKGIKIFANWNFRSGQPFTFASSLYFNTLSRPVSGFYFDAQISGIWGPSEIIQLPTLRNSNRMKDYHRLDLGISIPIKSGKIDSRLDLGLYNVYNRANPYYYFQDIDITKNESGKTIYKYVLKQVSYFPILPVINFSFNLH